MQGVLRGNIASGRFGIFMLINDLEVHPPPYPEFHSMSLGASEIPGEEYFNSI